MPRWKELKRFCDRDGWELYKDTDHYFYETILKKLYSIRTSISTRDTI